MQTDKINILIVDDEEQFLSSISPTLEAGIFTW